MIGRVKINRVAEDDATSVSNIFIDEYLAEANDAQIKVYLYLLRMMSTGCATSVADLADHFNHTEKDILRALRYWEKKRLLGLEYDETGRLSGIHIEEVRHQNGKAEPLSIAPMPEETVAPAPVIQTPATSPVLFIAEQYFGRTLNSTEMETVLRIQADLHFSEDLLDYLLQHCAGRHVQDFRYVERVACAWADKGITTVEAAKREALLHDADTREILRALGIDTTPTDKELSFLTRWRQEYGFSQEIIREACDRTVLAVSRGRIRYCDGILRHWHEEGVTSLEDIRRLDVAHAESTAQHPATRERGIRIDARNRFGQFAQSDNDYAALERLVIEN
ncbi:MAG: DnaD domain protein [Butyrivibrio sp.]|nr:DnaD domain protein [Butyrivibrio sp.]